MYIGRRLHIIERCGSTAAGQPMKGKKTMKRSTKNFAKICLFICAILCAVLIVLQLFPSWTYQNTETNSTDTISILEYTVLPSAHPDVTKYLNTSSNEAINSVAGTFCIVFMLGITSIVFFFVKPNALWTCLFPLAIGGFATVGYLTDPAYQLGSLNTVLIILSALLTVFALIATVIWVHSFKYWFMDPKDWPSAKE